MLKGPGHHKYHIIHRFNGKNRKDVEQEKRKRTTRAISNIERAPFTLCFCVVYKRVKEIVVRVCHR